jgi:hypothetical protein
MASFLGPHVSLSVYPWIAYPHFTGHTPTDTSIAIRPNPSLQRFQIYISRVFRKECSAKIDDCYPHHAHSAVLSSSDASSLAGLASGRRPSKPKSSMARSTK